MRAISLLAALVPAVLAAPALAMDPIPGEEKFTNLPGQEQKNTVGAELGFGALGEDYLVRLNVRTGLSFGKVSLGFQIPLNLRVVDLDPQNDDDYGGVIPRQEWDEFSDWLKIIRYVRYGHKHSDDLLFVSVGELIADVGHGTIMNRYMNNLDLATFNLGSQLDVYTKYGGVETVVNDWGALFYDASTPRLVGGRLYVKPVGFFAPDSVFNMFSIGTTVIADINAPRTIATTQNEAGTIVNQVDENDHLVPAREAAQIVYGFDVDAKVLNTELIKLMPYIDFNVIDGAGWGFHAGALLTLSLSAGIFRNKASAYGKGRHLCDDPQSSP